MKNICAQFKKDREGFSLDMSVFFPSGQITALLGPSGSGKTTLLRLLAGLEKADEGQIKQGEERWLDSTNGLDVAIQKRKIGFVFQDYALFSHLTVAENIVYGVPKDDRIMVLYRWLDRLNLKECEHKYPHELSGGQRQRVALGRALAIEPSLLLLDEPFSALDIALRSELRQELSNYLKDVNCPVVLVTHDIHEARQLADQLYIVDDGKIIRSGTVEKVFSHPANYIAARTLGWTNFLEVNGKDNNTAYGPWGLYNADHQLNEDTSHLAFQPHHVRINSHDSHNAIYAMVKQVSDCGAYREISVECDGGSEIKIHRFWDEPVPVPGSSIALNISPAHMHTLSIDEPLKDDNGEDCIYARQKVV